MNADRLGCLLQIFKIRSVTQQCHQLRNVVPLSFRRLVAETIPFELYNDDVFGRGDRNVQNLIQAKGADLRARERWFASQMVAGD